MRCGKRAQAAMEFLMTYGWALLVVLIAISALAFFGVLNPGRFLPETCVLGPGLACADFKITSFDNTGYPDPNFDDADRVIITVTNGFGSTLDVFTIQIVKESATSTEVCGGLVGVIAISNANGAPPISSAPFNNMQEYLTYQGNINLSLISPYSNKLAAEDFNIFADGATRHIVPIAQWGAPYDLSPGINCNPTFDENVVRNNCCANFNVLFSGLEPFCSAAGPTFCDTMAPMPNPGKKFSADLIITYREAGSKILHQRIGKVTAQTEHFA